MSQRAGVGGPTSLRVTPVKYWISSIDRPDEQTIREQE